MRAGVRRRFRGTFFDVALPSRCESSEQAALTVPVRCQTVNADSDDLAEDDGMQGGTMQIRKVYQQPTLRKRDKLALISALDEPLISIIAKP
jgi:hypothetical protein